MISTVLCSIIGSFTYQEVLGGMVLVAGILVISMAKGKSVLRGVRARKTPHKQLFTKVINILSM
jgi:hypothetical protein